MNKREISLIALHLELSNCLTRNAVIVAANPALQDAQTTLNARIILEQELEKELEKIITGAAAAKQEARLLMASYSDAMRRRVQSAYALHNDTQGFDNANITYSAVAYGNYATCISRAANVFDMAQGLSAADKTAFMVTVPNLTQLEDSIQNCRLLISGVRSVIVLRQNVDNNLKQTLKGTAKFIHQSLDSLIGNYRVTNPSFYNEYLISRFIVNPRASHAQITGTVLDATNNNAPLHGVKVTASNGLKVYEDMTDKLGFYKIPVSPELYNISFDLKSYNPATKSDILVDAGEREKVDIQLNKTV